MFGWIKEFKTFAMRGNVVDMAVGIIIGASFTKVVNSLVSDIIMPPIGVILGGVDFNDLKITLKSASEGQEAVTLSYGAFFTSIVDFLIVAFAIFLLVKGINKLKKEKKEEVKEVDCGECLMKIPRGAKKCGHCGTPQ